MNQNRYLVAGAGIILATLLFFGWLNKPEPKKQSSGVEDRNSAGVLLAAAGNAQFDFGKISMQKGPVRHAFEIKNDAKEPADIIAVYTSCMCTAAELIKDGKRIGPFGMPGHGFMPRIKETLLPGETARIEAIFDPAAHGPAGIGRTERIIYVETEKGLPLELWFTAFVTP